MNEYLTKYPTNKEGIGVLVYALGVDIANKICLKALKENKKIQVENDPLLMDKIYYKFTD